MANEKNGVAVAKKARVWESILKEKACFKGEPQRILPTTVGVAKQNRKGVPPNIAYIYGNLSHNMKNDGYCQSREKIGVVLRYAAGPKLEAQRKHQQWLKTIAPQKWPPVDEASMHDFTLANTHINIKLRLHAANHQDPSSGVSFAVEKNPIHPDHDEQLCAKLDIGLKFYVLDGDQITDEEAYIVSEWFNSDQDQNSASSECSMIQSIMLKASEMGESNSVVSLAGLVQRVTESSLVKLRPNTVAAFARWVMDYMSTPTYITDWVEFISEEVDTGNISASPNFFESVAKLLGTQNRELKLNVCQIVYDPSVVDRRQRPQPDGCQFVVTKDIEALAKDEAKTKLVNDMLKENCDKFGPLLKAHVTEQMSKKMLRLLNHNITRLALGKPLLKDFKLPKSVLGKWDPEKVPTIRAAWAAHIQSTWASLSNFATDAGLAEDVIKLELGGPKAYTNYERRRSMTLFMKFLINVF